MSTSSGVPSIHQGSTPPEDPKRETRASIFDMVGSPGAGQETKRHSRRRTRPCLAWLDQGWPSYCVSDLLERRPSHPIGPMDSITSDRNQLGGSANPDSARLARDGTLRQPTARIRTPRTIGGAENSTPSRQCFPNRQNPTGRHATLRPPAPAAARVSGHLSHHTSVPSHLFLPSVPAPLHSPCSCVLA
jgi:hypothetical protein